MMGWSHLRRCTLPGYAISWPNLPPREQSRPALRPRHIHRMTEVCRMRRVLTTGARIAVILLVCGTLSLGGLAGCGSGDVTSGETGPQYQHLALEELLPGVNYLAYFHRAPLVWGETTGSGVTVAIDGDYGAGVTAIAPGATVIAADLPVAGDAVAVGAALDALAETEVRAIALYDPLRYGEKTLTAIVAGAAERGMAVLIGLAPGTPPDASGRLAAITDAGAVLVGPLDWEGSVLLSAARQLPVTVYASGGGFPGDRVDWSLGCALGTAALLAGQSEESAGAVAWPAAVRAGLYAALPAWVNGELGTGEWVRAKFSVDRSTATYINHEGFAFRLLDVPSILGLEAADSAWWPLLELSGLEAAHHRATGRGVRVAIIDTGFWPEVPSIAARIGVTEAIGGAFDELGGFHGTSMGEIVLTVAPDAELLLIAVGTQQPGVDDELTAIRRSIAQAVERAVELGSDVISLSFKPVMFDDHVQAGLERAVAAGVVVAAVNSGVEAEGVIATEALSDGYYQRLYETGAQKADLWLGDRHIDHRYPVDLWAGNSNTAPQAAGMAAVLLEVHPEWTPAQVEAALVSTALVGPGGRACPRVDRAVASQDEGP